MTNEAKPLLSETFLKIAQPEPNSAVKCTYHYLQRFSERVARKCRRRWHFAEQAYLYGIDSEDIKNCHFRRYCESREISYQTKAKIYHGFIYWFRDNIAITIIPIPKQFQGSRKNIA